MANPTTHLTITEDAVEAIIQKYNEPDWLANERRAALRSFEALPAPTNRDEVWRYSQLERFGINGLELVKEPRSREVSNRIQMRITDSDAEGVLVHKGPEVVYRRL